MMILKLDSCVSDTFPPYVPRALCASQKKSNVQMTESKIACRHPVYAKDITLRDSEMSTTPKIIFLNKKNSKSKIQNPEIYINI